MPPRQVKAWEEMIRRAETDAARLEAEAAQLRESIKATRFLLDRYGSNDEGDSGDDGATGSRVRAETKEARNGLWEILRAAPGPMHARDLLVALQERGIEVRGKDPTNNVRAHLSHDDRFTSVGSGEWDLTSRVKSQDRSDASSATEPPSSHSGETVGLDRWAARWVPTDSAVHDDSSIDTDDGEEPSEDDLAELDRLLHESSQSDRRRYADMDDVPF